MNKENESNIKKSLRAKIFTMNINLIAAAVILFTAVGIFQVWRFGVLVEETSRKQNQVIMDTTSDSMQ